MGQAQVVPQLYDLDLLQRNFVIRRRGWRLLYATPRAHRVKAGDLADTKINSDGYRVATLYVDGVRRYVTAARVIWVLVHKRNPGCVLIDHWDRNRLNNDPANLRIATDYQSVANRSITTQTIGVRLARGGLRYEARSVDSNGRYVHLGTFDTIEEATMAYTGYAAMRFPEEAIA